MGSAAGEIARLDAWTWQVRNGLLPGSRVLEAHEMFADIDRRMSVVTETSEILEFSLESV